MLKRILNQSFTIITETENLFLFSSSLSIFRLLLPMPCVDFQIQPQSEFKLLDSAPWHQLEEQIFPNVPLGRICEGMS